MREKPVYLFTGFLGSGKSTFIQDTLETPEFGEGASTLLLVCESGEVHYDESKFTSRQSRGRQTSQKQSSTASHRSMYLTEF